MKTINWGIIGTGVIASKFAKKLKYVSSSKLLAVASRRIETAENFTNKHTGLKAYESYDKLVFEQEIDVIYIVMPNIFYKKNVILSLNNKHILCEKFFAMNEKEAQEVIELA